MSQLSELRLGFETAYIDGNVASNLAYKPQFVSNNYKEGKKVLVVRMNKNKKFQKEQLTKEGYSDIREFYKNPLA